MSLKKKWWIITTWLPFEYLTHVSSKNDTNAISNNYFTLHNPERLHYDYFNTLKKAYNSENIDKSIGIIQ